LAGKVVLITGTAGGQGRVAAQVFTREGATVVGCDVNADGNEETRRLVGQGGGEMLATAPVDLGDPEQATRWVREAAEVCGGIDVLYNNAGAPRFGPIAELSVDDWDFTIRNELTLMFHTCRAAWPYLVARGGASVVNIASYSAVNGPPGSTAHAAAKGGVVSFTRALAVEGGPYGIRANTILPGLVDTPASRRAAGPELFARLCSQSRLGRAATPEDVVACALYLASDESSIVTGTEMIVGGIDTPPGPQVRSEVRP
jgi:NAD(P)-dependent dehydrogenase (short-subunit alcohol dehydrogenase family)